MKRLILTVTGTVAGLAALLSFKTQSSDTTVAGALPSAGTAAGSSTAAPAPSSATPSSSSPSTRTSSTARSSTPVAKSYVGQAVTTRYGIVQVKVTVAGSKIAKVSFTQLTAFDGHSARINSQAGPMLLQETLSQQTAKVDVVSGATYTSDGYRESLQSALDEAGFR